MNVDVDLIKQRKQIYGNNMNCIARFWESYMKNNDIGSGLMDNIIDGGDVAHMMALMKECRIRAIQEKMDDEVNWSPMWVKLKESLDDSIKDKMNYLWISDNYKEYEEI